MKSAHGQARAEFKTLHKSQVVLTKELETYQQRIEQWTENCRELQLLKFGQLTDLEHIDSLNGMISKAGHIRNPSVRNDRILPL